MEDKTERKPIVVMYLPRYDYFRVDADALMASFNGTHHKITMPDGFSDYLWFVFTDTTLTAPEIKVFHVKDYTKVQYEKLEQMINESIKAMQTIENK